MKISCIVLIALLQTLVSPAQNQYGRQPYKYNSFIMSPGITWACEMYNSYEFDQQADKPFDIHGYLINAQKTGKIKSYLNTGFTPEDITQWKTKKITDYYFEISKDYSNQKLQAFTDSTRLIEFHEIFYLQNHQVKIAGDIRRSAIESFYFFRDLYRQYHQFFFEYKLLCNEKAK
jgi:hypothetical protein